jgi:transcription elongation factor
VLQVNEDFIKLINEQGKIENIKIVDLGKKLPAPSRGGTLGLDQMVKVVNGLHKGKIGPIKHAFKNYLFLWHKDFALSNGIFVENCRNVMILGAEFMKGVTG